MKFGRTEQFPIMDWILALGIAVVLSLFLNHAFNVAYPDSSMSMVSPCGGSAMTQDDCTKEGGTWSGDEGYCQPNEACMQKEQENSQSRQEKQFLFLVIAGIVVVAVGLMKFKKDPVRLGLVTGGIFTLFSGGVSFWGTPTVLHVAVLGIALVVLVWLAAKKTA